MSQIHVSNIYMRYSTEIFRQPPTVVVVRVSESSTNTNPLSSVGLAQLRNKSKVQDKYRVSPKNKTYPENKP